MEALQQYYLLIGLVLFQCLFINKLGKGVILFLIGLELWFLSGFRAWNVGNDTANYVGAFVHTYTSYAEIFSSSYMERGYQLFNQFVALFSNNPQMILIVTSAIIIGTRFLTISRYSAYVGFSVILFVILQFGNTLNIVRQEMALSVVLLFFPFVLKRKMFPFLVGCLFASSIHISALFTIPMYWLYQLPWKRRYIFLITISGIIALIALHPLLRTIVETLGRYESYMGNLLLGEETKVASIIKMLISGSILIFEVITFYIYKNKIQRKENPLRIDFLLYMALISFTGYMISIRGTLLERLTYYYQFFNILSLPVFIHMYRIRTRLFLILIIIGGFILQTSIILWFRPDWNRWLPYSFCF